MYTTVGQVLSTQEAIDLQLEQGGQGVYAASSALSIDGLGETPSHPAMKYLPWVGAGLVAAYFFHKARK